MSLSGSGSPSAGGDGELPPGTPPGRTERPVSVVHVIESGDTSGLFRGFARHHDPSRWTVSFVTLQDPETGFAGDLRAVGVEAYGLGVSRRREMVRATRELLGLLRRRRPAVVHAHLFRPSLVAMTAGWLARVPVRVVTRHHSDYHTRAGRWLPVVLDRWATLLAHRVVAVSEHVRRSMMEEEQAAASEVVTIPNGVDAERFRTPDPDRASRLREELAGPGERVILAPARLHPEKGHPTLFQALERLVESGLDIRLWVAGQGPFERQYREQVEGLGLVSRVDFLGFRPDVAALMMAADAVAVASEAEAFGLVVLEARALGRAVVATRVGEIPRLLDEGRAGILVPPGDPVALAEGLARVLTDPLVRSALEDRGGAHLLEEWSMEGMVRRYEELYDEIRRQRATR